MLPVTLPTADDLTELIRHRTPASVSLYVESSPLPRDIEKIRIAVKNHSSEAEQQLTELGIDTVQVRETLDPVRALVDDLPADDRFWMHQARSLAIFTAPGSEMRLFKLPTRLKELVAVGDRYDIGPLLRSISFRQDGYVVTVSEGGNHLYELMPGTHPHEIPLPDLPHDLHTVLEHAENYGQMDMPRPQGSTGERIELQRYCRIVQDEVLKELPDQSTPLILAASHDFTPAYRAINTHRGLLDTGIDVNPEALSPDDLEARAREILDAHYKSQLMQWRERFGTERSNGRATTRLKEVAYAATAAAVAELHFNMDDTSEGTIDEQGVVHPSEPGPGTYGLTDEIAVRVMTTGGVVRAVRNEDLIDGSPVAAILRYQLEETR